MSHILVVDDEAGFRDVLKRILVSAGYDVQVAIDAHDALRSIDEAAPAVVFCDIHMPGRDGLWLVEQLRQRPVMLPVVLCTSDDTIPPMETLRDGIVAYVIKPFQRRAILAAAAQAADWYRERTGGTVTRTKPVLEEEQASPSPRAAPTRSIHRRDTRAPRLSRGALIAIVVAVLVAAAAAGYWLLTRESRALARVAAASGVIVVSDGSGTPMAQGSGFFVAGDTFVTSRHVVDGAVQATIRRGDGTSMPVRGVLASDRRTDLVVLKTVDPSPATLALETSLPALGDEVLVYGAPLGLNGTLSKGIVNAAPDPEGTTLQISAPISQGSSGSPVVNRDGRVVGIAAAVRFGEQGLGFAVPAQRLSELLERAGPVEPLLAASRGSGTDLERAQLIGPVRRVVESACGEPAIEGCTTTLLFDRTGRLLQRDETRNGVTTTSDTIDEPVAGSADRETRADGSEIMRRYVYDSRGNWQVRTDVVVGPSGEELVVGRRTRQIEYWD